ncbi:hypothetical protein RHGRI_022018 [Rhododendron griersonianum]|uniref:F-box domain-containing protein n=1 Tax=Rhododendron griersonianum TaxID=479676 RepID=A0AAV6JQI4_9ERIC|nr:hypothetical protein RHGRI_022018 [Rhododendron griersonianum]KAG5542336.1 hypothetical protein RHGRI_022018 [Rhododendron griersonianum]
MGKRVRRSSVCPKHQRDKHLEDRISQLPDGILSHILSLLKIREAGRSSVLSCRWRDLWKFTTSLNFDASETILKLFGRKIKQERSKYVAWVNQVLKLHLRPSLDEFRVSFFLDSRDSCIIDEWINFVIPKRVKILEIDLQPFSLATLYTPSQECYLSFKSPSNLSSIKCLTSLSLQYVNVNGELIEYFLSNCPHLEQLRLFWLEQIVNLNVSGPALQLKHLEIYRCKLLESLEFCAPKLVTFKYFGHTKIRLSMGNLPLLAELDISASQDHQATYALVPFSSYLSKIETLKLDLWLPEDYEEIPQIPELTKLKHLTLDVEGLPCSRFPWFTSLLEAAPSLLSFKLSSPIGSRAILPQMLTPHPHECLKDVEIFGFVNRKLVMYLLQNAINLEKITIDPYHPSDRSGKYRKSKKKQEARAHQLREELPFGFKITVL